VDRTPDAMMAMGHGPWLVRLLCAGVGCRRTYEFCSFSLICLAVGCRFEPADSGRVDDGQTNSILFDLSVWPSTAVPNPADSGQDDDRQTNSELTTDRRILFLFDLSVWPSIAVPNPADSGQDVDRQTNSVLFAF
jgi:hypothetical protein